MTQLVYYIPGKLGNWLVDLRSFWIFSSVFLLLSLEQDSISKHFTCQILIEVCIEALGVFGSDALWYVLSAGGFRQEYQLRAPIGRAPHTPPNPRRAPIGRAPVDHARPS